MNEIAYEADVSIETLYYHFPEGKVSILMEIRRRVAEEYLKNFSERFDLERIWSASSFDEGLRLLLMGLIEVHREERLVLAAMESEILSNLVSYDQVTQSISVKELVEADARPVVGMLENMLEKHPDEGLALDGRGAMVSKIIDI